MTTWDDSSPRERAQLIRQHVTPKGNNANIAALFCLTPEGLTAILAGDDWCHEYSTDHKIELPAWPW